MGYNKRRGKTFYESNYPVFGGLIGLVLFAGAVIYFGGSSSFRAVGAGIFGAIIFGAILGSALENLIERSGKEKDNKDMMGDQNNKNDS